MPRRPRLAAALRASLLAGFALAVGAADLPGPIHKLNGSSEETARAVMTQHGFVFRSERSSWGRKFSVWWNDRTRQCAQLAFLAGRVYQVEQKGESDCRVAPGQPGAGGAIDPLALVGQPAATVQKRLEQAGFRNLGADMSKGDTVYIKWTDGRQCLAGEIVNERYTGLSAIPLNHCT